MAMLYCPLSIRANLKLDNSKFRLEDNKMSKYYNSDYAINKNKKGIVYRNSDGSILEITFEKISQRNPNFTQEDFDKLKAFSDQIYLEEQRADVKYRKYVTGSVDSIEDSKWLKVESFEDEVIEFMNGNRKGEIMQYINTNLTEVQRRRFLMFANGISTVKIAEIEGCRQNAVWKSVERAREKIKKFLEKNKKTGGRNGSKKI